MKCSKFKRGKFIFVFGGMIKAVFFSEKKKEKFCHLPPHTAKFIHNFSSTTDHKKEKGGTNKRK